MQVIDIQKISNKCITNFKVCGYQNGISYSSLAWFPNNIGVPGYQGVWENDTFNIIDYFTNTDKIYIDIGAWIGPTVLYSSNKFKKVLCFEPDPIAYNELIDNININKFDNIICIPKAISDKETICKFGGNGKLGNSESTLLVNFSPNEWREQHIMSESEKNNNYIVDINTTTLEAELLKNDIIIDNIALIKIDIEGGEIIVIPHLKEFLSKYKPVLYISLHYCFLKEDKVFEIIDILFGIYTNCMRYNNDTHLFEKLNIDYVKASKESSLLFM
jgi:FkbM family methyltransferase